MNRPDKNRTYLPDLDSFVSATYMSALSKDIMQAILDDGAISTPFGTLIIEGSKKLAPSAKLSKLYGKLVYVDNSHSDGYRFTVKYKPNWNHYIVSRYNTKKYCLKFKPYDVFKGKIFRTIMEGLWLNWYRDDRQ